MKFKITVLAIALASLSGSVWAGAGPPAQNATATFQVTASVSATCVISATNVAFGAITPAATGTATTTGTITSTCTKTTPYTLALNAGGGTIAARTMAGGTAGNTDKLAYNIYTDAGATLIFGDGTAGNGSTVGLTGTGAAQTTTIYGQSSLNQYVKPDAYSDNLTVTMTY
ncbi:spore coat protein U domain-containing protein [Delftia acidovorans]|uniref:spore coat protein U domain-containing protein n=1 Tax=Delftia acidovorans TaxID=80866 RepID=UPI003C6CA899